VGLRVAWCGHAGGRRADGLSAYSAQTVAALVAAGCTVRFFHHEMDGDRTPVDDAVALDGVRFKTVTIPVPRTRAAIERSLAEFHPDVVHLSLSVSVIDGAVARTARRLGAATVVTCHLPYAAEHSIRGRTMRGIYRYHTPRLRQFDRCIALSEGQRDLLVGTGLPAERIVIMPTAVDARRISPGPSALREKLGAALLVSYLGRLDPEKRVEELIQSFLARRWPDDHLLLVAGHGSQDRRLRALADRGSGVRILGVISDEDRLDLLRATDIFVLPSTAEGLSLALLEAMAAGCPIIGTAAGEHAGVLDGAGVLVPTNPLEPALGEALESLRADPGRRRRLGAAARRRAVERYSLDAYVTGLLSLYEETLNRGPVAETAGAGRLPAVPVSPQA